MSTIDSRVVEMNFDGSKFGTGVKTTLDNLTQLKNGLKLDGATKGLDDVSAAAGRFSLAGIANGVDAIAGKFTTMSMIGITAMTNLVNKAVDAGLSIAKSLTIDPVKAGFQSYTDTINATQTILANTQAQGVGLQQVTDTLAELQKYANQTVYSFSDMTKNIALFTAAGVSLKDSTSSIKGLSNLAAMSGVDAAHASGAMYQLSQAISSGTVKLQDWNSVQQAGLGGTTFQNALIQTAKVHGVAVDGMIKKDGSFRDSLKEGWLSSQVLTETLNQFTGDLSDAQLKSMGYSDAEVASIQKLGKTALDSAVKIRTIPQMMDALHEEVATAWGSVFKTLFGDVNQATDLFTGMHNVLENLFTAPIYALNTLLTGWAALGGRTKLIEGLSNAFKVLGPIMQAVHTAFRDIFPQQSAQSLYNLTDAFSNFMADLIPSEKTIINLVRTFDGFFAILHIGWTIIKDLLGFVVKLFGGLEEGNKGILETTATIGDFFIGLDAALSKGDGFKKFLDTVFDQLMKIINPIKDAGKWLGNLFDTKLDLSVAGGQIGDFVTALLTFGGAADKTSSAADKIKGVFESIGKFIATFAMSVAKFMKPVTDAISNALQNLDFDKVMEFFQTLALGGIAGGLMKVSGTFKKLFDNFKPFQGAGGGIVDKIKESLEGLSGTLKSMQANLKANVLLKIAAAIALLAVSIVLLASVDAAGLARATAAITVMFVELGAAMKVFGKIGSISSIAKLNLMGAALILMGVAIMILAGAVKILGDMPYAELTKGMLALTVLIAGIIVMSKNLDRSRGAIIRSSAALIIMSVAIMGLVASVEVLGRMNFKQLVKGLGGVAILLAGIVAFEKAQGSDKKAAVQAAEMLIIAGAIRILADAVKILGSMSWEQLAKGFAGAAAGIVLIGVALDKVPTGPKMILSALAIGKVASALMLIAMAFKAFQDIRWQDVIKGLVGMGGALWIMSESISKMPKLGLPQSLGLLLVAGAIYILGQALAVIGALSIKEIIKGMAGIAGVMGILVIALDEFKGSEKGAAAILIVAVALNVLLPVITTLGKMPIASIVVALVALAAVFVIIGVAANALAESVPVLIGLGIAIGLLGLALALAGAGVFLFATGLTLLGVAGASATAGIVAIVAGLIGLIPMVIQQIGIGIVAFAQVIADSGPAILGAITAVLLALLQAIIDVTPKIVETFLTLLFAILSILQQAVPQLIQTGIALLSALLQGIGQNIGQIVDKAVTIVVNFVEAIARNLPRIVQAGIDLILSLMNAIGDAARNNGPKLADASWNMVTGIIDGIVSGLGRLGGKFTDALVSMAKAAFKGLLHFFGINSPSKLMAWVSEQNVAGLVQGINDHGQKAVDATAGMGSDIVSALGKTISGLGDMIGGEVDMTPVITPVLDLSSVRDEASNLGSILNAPPLDVGASYSGAATASAEYLSNQAAANAAAAAQDQTGVTFIQNNSSPKALSAAEIYRNTNSQLSTAKEALKTNAG